MSGLLARRARKAVAGGFNPLSYGSPVHAFWAEDPDWSNPGDGNAVSTWRNDGSDGTAATQATGSLQPIYRSSGIGGQPAIEFDGAGDFLLAPEASTGSVSQPGTLVLVTDLNRPNVTTEVLVDGDGTRWNFYIDAANDFSMGTGATFQKTALTGTAALNDPRVFVGVFNGTSSTLRSNGSAVGTTYNPGSAAMDGVTIGNVDGGGSTVAMTGMCALVMVYAIDITGESWFSGFESDLITHYGI